PLLGAELPDWMLLHFQVSVQGGWSSPHVLSKTMLERFQNAGLDGLLVNVKPDKEKLLAELCGSVTSTVLAALADRFATQPGQRDTALLPRQGPPGDLANSPNVGNASQNPNLNQMSQVPQQPGPNVDPGYAQRIGSYLRASQENKGAVQREDLE